MVPPTSPRPSDNLQAMKLPALGQPEQGEELQQLFISVVAKTDEGIRWYDRHKAKNKRRAVILRGLAIGLAGAASILPIIVSMFPKECDPARRGRSGEGVKGLVPTARLLRIV